MDSPNETFLRKCTFLDDSYFKPLYTAFLAAFADYVLPFDLTEQQFQNHITLNAVDLRNSVAYMDDGEIVAFTLNGFGEWNGRATVYDAGTGVLPEFRRKGIGRRLFEEMMPIFAGRGYEQLLLEVITTNDKATGLYNKLGFKPVRELALFEATDKIETSKANQDITVTEIRDPDWDTYARFWDGMPSWQNSLAAMERSRINKTILEARSGDTPVGYIVFSTGFGRVAQMAVEPKERRSGIGSRLIAELCSRTENGHKPRVINCDVGVESCCEFLKNRGFSEALRQYEMIIDL